MAHGSNLDVDATAEQLTSTSNPLRYGVEVLADPENGGYVYVGTSSSVTAGSNGTTDGFKLAAGKSVFLPAVLVTDTDEVYLIASAANQKVFWIGA